eukprot:TRINITY_DN27815_c0_g1_i1.p1 TRINITY_DN27815_c0_g1~~TRINITY_DN27815_c0_g1_i1.p1  ORF type:complete len:527 (+),score=138.52 TRINITY_DN27815_c0_g1_i1:49-1629(+)
MSCDEKTTCVSTRVLLKELEGRLEGDKAAEWKRFVDGMSSIVHHCKYKAEEGLKLMVHKEEVYRGVDDEKWKEYRASGLKRLLQVIRSAKYEPLSEEEFQRCAYTTNFAASLHAEVGMPLSTPHPLLCTVLSRFPFWRDEDPYRQIPIYCNRVLLYKTGYGVECQTGFFAFAKANVLLDMVKNKAFEYLVSINLLNADPTPKASPTPADSTTPAIVTVKHIVDKEGVGSLFRSLTISYPTFKNLVVIHPKEDGRGKGKRTLKGLIKEVDQKARGHEHGGGGEVYQGPEGISKDLKISSYTDLPLHDLGLVLPDKLLTTTNVDFLSFVVEFLMIVTVLQQGWAAIQYLDLDAPGVRVFLLTVFPACMYRVCMLGLNWIWALDYYKSIAQRYILSKRSSNGPSAVAGILNDLEDKDLKLILLAFYVLWTSDGPLTVEQLDTQAKSLLSSMGCSADFDASLALEKLETLSLIRYAKRIAPKHERYSLNGVTEDRLWSVLSTPTEFLDSPLVPWQEYLDRLLTGSGENRL